jgi:hypothetical protein
MGNLSRLIKIGWANVYLLPRRMHSLQEVEYKAKAGIQKERDTHTCSVCAGG